MSAIDQALEILAAGGIADDEHLRDALWLSQFLPTYPLEEPDAPGTPEGKHPAGKDGNSKRPEEVPPKPGPPPASAKAPVARLYPSIHGGQPGNVPAAPVYVPASGALPHPLDLARALRPFGRKTRGRRLRLDEQATVETSAAQSEHEPIVVPVFTPAPERWFSVALVFDDTPGMAPWRKTADEFTRLLGGLGLFRDVRLWMLTPELRLRSARGPAARLGQLSDPAGRTIVLMLTNGVGAHWRTRGLIEQLEQWARSGPVAICSLLPSRRWAHTDLGSASLWVQAPVPGAPNAALRSGEGLRTLTLDPGVTPYPVFPLTKDGLAQWAGMQMSRREESVSALLLAPEWFDQTAETAAQTVDVTRRIGEFAAIASGEAVSLLRFFSAVPLTLPIMRLVQEAMLPGCPLSAMSEVLMSGLIRPVHPEMLRDDPENLLFDFIPGAREELRAVTGVGELERIAHVVRDAIRQHIERKAGVTIHDFEAWVASPGGKGTLNGEAQHFAEVMSATLAAMGYQPPVGSSEPIQSDRITVFVSYAHAGTTATARSRVILDRGKALPSAASASLVSGLESGGGDRGRRPGDRLGVTLCPHSSARYLRASLASRNCAGSATSSGTPAATIW
ncbi:MAG: SAV_2336 N-terminal domain-related protein [Bryobacteraceae bacterium]